ncbi:MAG: SIS domain-containing protein [Thermoplasmata archaeon]|nr:SIS domain-containing protein [Thermoplasmata archaeon]
MGAPHSSALYQSIHQQPDVLRDILRREARATEHAAEVLAGARRVYLTGTGTSGHAAIVTEYLYRSLGLDAEARSAFDLSHYGPRLRPDDVVVAISHRGSKRYGNRVLELAQGAGARSIGVTGLESPMSVPEVILHTSPQEKSSTHTMSYTGTLMALAMTGAAVAERGGGTLSSLRPVLEEMPTAYEDILRRQHVVQPMAQSLARSGRLVLAGAGPNIATAREGALKVKESSYLVAEGFEMENLLHGGLQALKPGDTAAVIFPHGPPAERATDVVRALRLLGAEILIVRDQAEPFEQPANDLSGPAVSTFLFPKAPELLSAMVAVLPLQLLACFTAEIRGTNPDMFRADDPAFKRISDSYTL